MVGVEVIDVFFFISVYGVLIYYIIVLCEVFSNLVCYDGVYYGFCEVSVEIVEEMYLWMRLEGFGKEVKC